MTPEQKQFYDKLGDALRGVTKNHKQNLDVVTVDCEDITVINHAAQKLHDLWPTLCEPEWQPIETAPKDGTNILAIVAGCRTIILWGKCSHVPLYGWIDVAFADYNDLDFCDPECWMPLPEPPTISKAVGGGDE